MLPRERHRPRRRADRPRRGRADACGRRRGAPAPHGPRGSSTRRRGCTLHIGVAAAASSPARSGAPFRQDVHDPRRHRRARRSPDGAGPSADRCWTTPETSSRARRRCSPATALDAVPGQGQGGAGRGDRPSAPSSASARPRPARELPLVDRERELPVLERRARPRAAGLRQLRRARRRARDRQVAARRGGARDRPRICPSVATACEQYESTTPYFPFRELLRSAARRRARAATPSATRARPATASSRLAPELVPWMPLLGCALDVARAADAGGRRPPAGVPTGAPARRRRRRCSAQLLASPTLILFEDVHWMDEASSDLLRHLGSRSSSASPGSSARRAAPSPAASRRPKGRRRCRRSRCRLDPLPDEDAQDARGLCRSRGPRSRRAARDRRARRRQPALPPGARRRARHRLRAARTLPESVEALVDDAHRPALGSGPCAASLGLRARRDLRERRARAGARRAIPTAALDSEAWDRLDRVRRARPQRRRRVPVPPRALPRRGVRGPLLPTAA